MVANPIPGGFEEAVDGQSDDSAGQSEEDVEPSGLFKDPNPDKIRISLASDFPPSPRKLYFDSVLSVFVLFLWRLFMTRLCLRFHRDGSLAPKLDKKFTDPKVFYVSPFQHWAGPLVSKVNKAGVLDDQWLPGFTKGTSHFRGVFSKLLQENGGAVAFMLQKEVCGMIVLGGCLDAVCSAATLGAPWILHLLLDHLEDVSLAWALVIVTFLVTLSGRAKDQVCRVQGVWSEGMLRTVLFQKSLLLAPAARIVYPPAKIINMSNVDVDFISSYILKIHDIWSAPLQIVGIIVLTVRMMGWSALVGFSLFAVILFVQSYSGKWMRKSIRSYIQLNDKRLGLLRDLLNGISSVKAVAVEEHYRTNVGTVRKDQLSALAYYLVTAFGVFTAVNQTTPYLTACAAFLAYYLTGNTLTSSVVFPALTYFNLLYGPVTSFSLALSRQFAVRPSFTRLKGFLLGDESCSAISEVHEKQDVSVTFSDAIFQWPGNNSSENQLRVGTVCLPRGAMTAVIGTNGCGKSSFLQAILGEMSPISGCRNVYGSVAYAPQEPWLMAGTLRDNVVFNHEYDADRYRKVIRMLGLHVDFGTFPDADQSVVAESGSNLSGGQRARVSVARAIYSEAEIILLDDPFSALDAKVRSLLFSSLRSLEQTIVLATLHTNYVAQSDHVVVLNDRTVAWSGARSEFVKEDWSSRYLHGLPGEPEFKHVTDNIEASKDSTEQSSASEAESKQHKDDGAVSKLVEEEDRARGAVKWSVVKFYISAAGGITHAGVVLALTLLVAAIKVISQYWFVWWINGSLGIQQLQYMFGYLGLTLAQGLVTVTLGTILVRGSLRAGRLVHDRIIDHLVSAPLWYFQQQPTGRILNRLSKDVESLDTKIMNAIDAVLAAGTTLIASVVTVAASGYLMFVVILPFIAIVGWYLQRFRVTAREVQRSNSILQSPVISMLTESLKAPASIKAYGAVQFLVERHGRGVDLLMSSKIVRRSLDTWMTFRAETAAVLVLLAVALISAYGVIPPVQAGLALSVATTLAKNVYLLAWGVTDFEIQMNSTERLQNYHDEMPREGHSELVSQQPPPSSWPGRNTVEVKDAFLKFSSRCTPSLDHISLKVEHGERIGIVGRTGSGKSTLIAAIARLVDLDSGSITVGGVDTRTLDPPKLRKTVFTLPQEPLILRATLRHNLDPYSQHTDDEIWEALEACHLRSVLLNMYGDGALSWEIAADGAELSAGQRQLLCATRALLAKPSFLLVDEASANIDFATDDALQRAWQSLPVSTTLIVIAHRASSLTWMHRIIVMDNGMIVESDSPRNLLERVEPESYYRASVRQDGHEALLSAIISAKEEEGRIKAPKR